MVHLNPGELRERSVFINCPFDNSYRRFFYAVTFTIVRCWFVARCALGGTETSNIRTKRIADTIRACDLSVHDLSRMGLYGPRGQRVPRFNLPFELGLFLGACEFGKGGGEKSFLVMKTEQHRYKLALSDIGGQDAQAHNDTPRIAIECVRNYLDSQPVTGADLLPRPTQIEAELKQFEALLPNLAATFGLDHKRLTFSNRMHLIAKTVTAPEWPMDRPDR